MSSLITNEKLAIVVASGNGLQVHAYGSETALAEAAIRRTWREMNDKQQAAWLRQLADKVDAEAVSVDEEVSDGE